MASCKLCGEEDCDRHGFFLGKTVTLEEFSGSSPPEVFIGRWNYPNIYTGILSPTEYGDTQVLSSPELWHERKLSVEDILRNRNKLIYGRTQSNIRKLQTRFLSVLQEVAITHKPIATEFTLKRPIIKHEEQTANVPLIAHAAEVQNVRLEENPTVQKKVEYLVHDDAVKSRDAILELDKVGIATSSISKLLSAGLLGMRVRRKLVPTRWSITAVDDTLSKEKLENIRLYSEVSEISVFSAEYLGNHYEFLLLPGTFAFEVIEISMKNFGVLHDYESHFSRKRYADEVTGAYYVNRLALTEYLERVRKQGQCLVMREIRPEYSAPLGVGILRQVSREAFSRKQRIFSTLQEAFADIQTRLQLQIDNFLQKSWILQHYGKQKKLKDFFLD